MSDQTIFPEQTPTTPVLPVPPQAPAIQPEPPVAPTQFADLLSGIKNESGQQKYDSIELALQGAAHAQPHIAKLTTENSTMTAEIAALNAKLEALGSVNDIVAQLQTPAPLVADPISPIAPALSSADVATLVQNQINANANQLASTSNIKAVTDAMVTSFGENAEKQFYSKAQEKGFSPDQINSLAKANPKAVIELLIPKVDKSVNPMGMGNTSQFQLAENTMIKRSENKDLFNGATTEDIMAASRDAKAMVDELHAAGMDTWDLSDPKKYAQVFGKL